MIPMISVVEVWGFLSLIFNDMSFSHQKQDGLDEATILTRGTLDW